MPNERLGDAILRHGLTPDHVANALKVDRKTVERWITTGRTPYKKHRHAISAMVQETEPYLWPNAVAPERAAGIAEAEVVKVYPHRRTVPSELWTRLFDEATDYIEILVFSGLFLTDDPSLIKKLRSKAKAGTAIRLLFGDPTSAELTRRSESEGIGKNAISGKARNSLAFFQPLADLNNVQIRCHGTPLYNSLYRFDDQMLVNTQIYGFMAAHAPVLHLRQLSAGDMFQTYAESFDAVWNLAKIPKW
ncbi:MAG TPA: XRE family transcriptional regulator [Pseudonocardiaceae bacterium]|nr:XRE family transcriptional regulator [Pseudonocardiaceae bacterium]